MTENENKYINENDTVMAYVHRYNKFIPGPLCTLVGMDISNNYHS